MLCLVYASGAFELCVCVGGGGEGGGRVREIVRERGGGVCVYVFGRVKQEFTTQC